MNTTNILKEGDTIVLVEPAFSLEGVFEVNVQVVDVLENNLYRVKPISGHGCKVVSISELFF